VAEAVNREDAVEELHDLRVEPGVHHEIFGVRSSSGYPRVARDGLAEQRTSLRERLASTTRREVLLPASPGAPRNRLPAQPSPHP